VLKVSSKKPTVPAAKIATTKTAATAKKSTIPLSELVQIPIRRAIAEGLGVSVKHGYRLIKSGVLRTHNIGRRRFTTFADLQACVAELQRAAR